MNARVAVFLVIALVYFGFEIVVASRNGYRMEPEYVFGEFVSAAEAVSRCGTLKPVDAEKFNANFSYARRRAVAASIEKQPGEPAEAAEAVIAARESAVIEEVDNLVSELGCDDVELFGLRKRYENLTRLNLPTEPQDWSG